MLQAKIDEAMVGPGNERLKRVLIDIQNSTKKQWNRNNNQSTDREPPTDDPEVPPTVMMAAQSAYSVSNQVTDTPYVLGKSFVLDFAAIAHVCNDLARFKHFRAASPKDFLLAGQQTILVIGFGTVQIIV
jgi:hypothetical protein